MPRAGTASVCVCLLGALGLPQQHPLGTRWGCAYLCLRELSSSCGSLSFSPKLASGRGRWHKELVLGCASPPQCDKRWVP